MKDSGLGKPGVLASGLAAGLAVGNSIAKATEESSPAFSASVSFLMAVLGGAAGYAFSRLANRQDAADAARPATADEIALNGHLSRLAGAALRTLIEDEANKLPANSRQQRAAYTAAAAHAEEAWNLILKQGCFPELTGARLTDAVAAQAVAPGQEEVLEEKHWRPLIQFLLGAAGQKQDATWINSLASACVTGFAAQLHGQAKLSSTKEPAAFAALLIQFQAELRLTQREHTGTLTGLGEKIDAILAHLDSAARETTTAPDFDWASLTSHLAEATEAHEVARAFYASQHKNWDELLPLVRDIRQLLVDVQGAQHERLLHAIAGVSCVVSDKITEAVTDWRRENRQITDTVARILKEVLTQRQLDLEARRVFQGFLARRDVVLGRTGHHYYQPDDWSPGHRTRIPWREPGPFFVPRAPLLSPDDVPPAGSNYYLHGHSGHGKSILAANIADRLMGKGYRALTFNLRQPSDILRHLAALTDREWLGLGAPEDHKSGEAWAEMDKVIAAITWLLEESREGDRKHPPYCLVWDNADDLVTLDHLFQLQLLHHRGVQIITTRIPPTAFQFPDGHPCHDWPPRRLTVLPVGPYTETEAREHLHQAAENGRHTGMGGPAEADHDRIIDASRWAEDPSRIEPFTLQSTLDALRSRHWDVAAVLGAPPIPAGTPALEPAAAPPPTEAEIFAITLATLTPLTRAVWRLLVHLAPAPIPGDFWGAIESVLREGEDLTPEDAAALAPEWRERLPVVRARAALAEAGLLTGGDEGDLIHARHQSLGRETTPSFDRPAIWRQAVRVLRAAAPWGFPDDDLATWPWYRAAEPHLLAALAPDRAAALVPLRETGWLTNRFGQYLIQQSRLVEAESIERLNLEASLASDGEGSSNHATSLHELARCHLKQGRLAEAEAGFREAFAIKRRHPGVDHPTLATTLHELARCHLEQGRLAEAEAGFREALAIKRRHHGDDHPTLAATLHELARCHLKQGRLAEAEAGFREALAIDRRHHGDDHPTFATTLHELARCHLEQGRLAEAEAGFREALETYRRHHGDDHPTLANTLYSLARCHLEQGCLADAEAGFREALAIERRHHGDDHPTLATTLHNLARCHLEQGRLADAEAGFREALAIKRPHHGDDHPTLATTLYSLARCHLEQGRLAEAEAGFREALAIDRRHHGDDHPTFATTLHELARCHLDQGRLAEAEADFREALAIYRRHHGDASWEAALTRSNLARVQWRQGSREASATAFAEALAALEQALHPDHRRVGDLLFRWAECELEPIPGGPEASARGAESLDRLERARRIHLATWGEGHYGTANTRVLWAEALRRGGRIDEARAEIASALPVLLAALPGEHPAIARARAVQAALDA